jgi:tRNA nucleotidyltransferase/poly(A) polymerase
MRIKKKDLIFEERIKQSMPVPKEVLTIHAIFKRNGFKLYIVGGAVRDTLLNKEIKDYDLATDAPPTKVESMLADAKIKTIGTGASFGVINAFIGGEEYEIATFREDVGKGRRPDSVIFSDIETDVKRRDLTINALFYDIESKEIVDLVGGIDDIKNKVVRTVGSAVDRFDEDRLRILRAIRFAARIGSSLDPDIDKALRADSSLEGISGERIRDEFLKGIKSAKSVKQFLSLIDRYGLFDWVFRGIDKVNKSFIENHNPIVVISVLLKDADSSNLAKKLNELKYSIDEIRQITFLVAFSRTFNYDNFYTLKALHLKANLDDEAFKDFMEYLGEDMNKVIKFIDFKLTVKGEDITKEFGIGQGKAMGEKIKQLETELFVDTL